jgi:predicted nucleic acid-binding protein
MKYLLDTCCISELIKPEPDIGVLEWISSQPESDMYLSVVSFGELSKGIAKLPESKRKRELQEWVNEDLMKRFRNKILNLTLIEMYHWGEILANAEQRGTPVPAVDALIAATALTHNLSVVTRNTKDMKPTGVTTINPWLK